MYRIYILEAGQLIKNSKLDTHHRFENFASCEIFIFLNLFMYGYLNKELIVQKYTDNYKAELFAICKNGKWVYVCEEE